MAIAYLDHAASSPIRPAALEALTAASAVHGNASSLHASGRKARRVVEESRESIAADLGVRPSEVIFTSGGTESDNLAIKGLFWNRRAIDERFDTVVVSAIEHHAVLDAATWLAAREGARVVLVPVTSQGVVAAAAVADALVQNAGRVALVSVMAANNETGALQPISEISAACASAGVPFHTDAVQSAPWIPAASLTAVPDAITISGHKAGGPIGIGALIVRDVKPVALLHGGGQELDYRSGTLMTAQTAAMAAAFRAAADERAEAGPRISALRDRLAAGVLAAVPDAIAHCADTERLPGFAQFSFPGCEADAILMLLDAAGVECSAGSACFAGVSRPSHVLQAMGVSDEAALGAVRFSLGWNSTDADVDAALAALPAAIQRARRAGVRVTA